MAIRIRYNGVLLCASLHPEIFGDTYLDDETHYMLSVIKKILVTEPYEKHKERGQWWWKGSVPDDVEIDNYYMEAIS